jgi:uncharacterized protein YecE (DUF72 family)
VRVAGKIHIGTSGWNYRSWRGRFYPEKLAAAEWLPFYAKHFATVELNATFYHLPAAKTFRHWKQQAPAGFIYAVKDNRFITHLKHLRGVRRPLRLFLRRARLLGPHLGPVLHQLPPHWKPDLPRLKTFLAQLPPELTHVVEFRERAWLSEETFALLSQYGVCLCIHDLLPRHPRRLTGPVAYVRFHGAGTKYGGSYSRQRLRNWAKWLRDEAAAGHAVFAYFNNDRDAAAIANARTLCELLGVEKSLT